ncbi:hypothetical protein GQ42DRAFT_153329 [Ramicandelaber brevisporus]|nr:hypothetical protein GQ42DRAFT_153329 [Ramicandelaber brevisporus]
MNHGDDDDDDDDDDNKLFYAFCKMMSTLSRNLANDDGLIPEEHIMAARIGSIVYSLSDHLATLVDVEFEFRGDIVSLFVHVVYGAFFTVFLANDIFNEQYLPVLLGRLRLSQDGFKRLLPIIEAETGLRLVPGGATHCTTYTVGFESMTLATSRGICTAMVQDEMISNLHGVWVEAESKDGSKLVYRNLKCPGGDECPISCDQVQRVLQYKGNKDIDTKSKKKKKTKKSKKLKHKPFKPQSSEPHHDDTSSTKSTTSGYSIKQDEEDGDDDADGVDDYSESNDHDFQDNGLILPKDFIKNLTSRVLIVFLLLLPNGESSINNDHSANGRSLEDSINSTSSTDGAQLSLSYHACSYMDSWYPATTYFELLIAKTAVTSFKEACKLKGVCPGCLTAAVLRSRIALMLLAFGQFAGLVGANSLEPTSAKICLDCQGSTTCLHRADLYFIQAFRTLDTDSNASTKEFIGPYKQELPSDYSVWKKQGCYYLAQPNKAFLVHEIPDSYYVAMVGFVDILNNKVGRLTYFNDPVVVNPLSTPMIDFQYLK